MSAPLSPPPKQAPESSTGTDEEAVDLRRVVSLWAPLAASWLLMAMEPTLVIATISRLEGAKIQLAAWGSIVFPISLVVEGPIIMMLAASTRLSTSWDRYRKVMGYGHLMGGLLTVLHGAIAFTPLYDFVAVDIMGSAQAVVEPGRLGLQIMLPWTFAIGYRRAQQGVLIRYERSGAVGQGTLVRLATTASVLVGLGLASTNGTLPNLPGVAVAGIAIAVGVTSEAVFAGWKVREIFPRLKASKDKTPLGPRQFASFYAPLAMTPLITLLIQPVGASAMNRMPRELDSVATGGAVHALAFTARSLGMAFNEVVVTLVALRGGPRALRRFGWLLAGVTTATLALLYLTPLAGLWFGKVQELPQELVPLARMGLGICIIMPAYQVAQSWFQGVLVDAHRTRPITEAVSIYFLVAGSLLFLGTRWAEHAGVTGLAWTLTSFITAGLTQTAWLWFRSRGVAPK